MVQVSKGDSNVNPKKIAFCEKFRNLLTSHSHIVITCLDNVASKHIQEVRRKLYGDAVMLVGKNTTVRMLIRSMLPEFPQYESLLPLIHNNVGFVFTNSDLKSVCTRLTEDRVVAPAKVGIVSDKEVTIVAGVTNIEISNIGFFQALRIPTKINKSNIEIISDVVVLSAGKKVGPSEAVLLNMLNISPFSYGLAVENIFSIADGSSFSSELLDVTDDMLRERMAAAVRNVASLSLATGIINQASVPHMLLNAYKNVLSVAIATEVSFPMAESILDRINNPDAYASVAAPAASAAPAATSAAKAPIAAPVAEEEESEEEAGFDLFD